MKLMHIMLKNVIFLLFAGVIISHANDGNNNIVGLINSKLQAKDYTGAIDLCTKAIGDKPPYPVSLYFFRGVAYFALKDYSTALPDLDKAISLDSSNSDYYYWRGKAKMHSGLQKDSVELIKDGISDFDRAVQMKPDKSAECIWYRGIAKTTIRDIEGACADLQESKNMGYSGAEKMIIKYCK